MACDLRFHVRLCGTLIVIATLSYCQASAPGVAAAPTIPNVLTPTCPAIRYHEPPNDPLEIALKQRKTYRLVIGAGELIQSPTMNRSFVEPTAVAVDTALGKLRFSPIPGMPAASPYLVGKAATKGAIKDALRTMQQIMSPDDYAVIYYVGHGLVPPNNKDLALAVYDEPVASDSGIRVSDLLGILELTSTRSDIREIPHLLIVLDACLSGNAALGSTSELITKHNIQRIQAIENQVVPDQVAILSATSDGDSSNAYELANSGKSAFGFYFARALEEDWSCADLLPDGILTLGELKDYLYLRLDAAGKGVDGKVYTDKIMVPAILNRDDHAFIAYSPSHYSTPGLRELIKDLEIQPEAGLVAEVALPSGRQLVCAGTNSSLQIPSTCVVAVSQSLEGSVSLVTRTAADYQTMLDVAKQVTQAAVDVRAADIQASWASNELSEALAIINRPETDRAPYAMSLPNQTKDVDLRMAEAQRRMAEVEAAKARATQAESAKAQAAEAQARASEVQRKAAEIETRWADHDRNVQRRALVSFSDLLRQKRETVAGITLKIQ